MTNTAYVCKTIMAKLEIVQPQFVAELIAYINGVLAKPTRGQLVFGRDVYKEICTFVLYDDDLQCCSVCFDISLDHIETAMVLVEKPRRLIDVQLRDYFDAICVAQILAAHYDLGELEIRPHSTLFEGKTKLA